MNHINSNEDLTKIKQKIMKIITKYNSQNQKLDDFLSTDTMHNLSTHLAITIIRIQSKNYIPLSNSQIASIQEDDIYEYAKGLCQEIKEEFLIPFPAEEIAIVSMYLSKSHLLDMEIKSGFDLLDREIFYVLKDSMSDIYKSCNHDFRSNDNLWISIGLHLTPAVERLQNHQMLENPLTNNIKKEYPLAFSFADIINKNIKIQYHDILTEDELAFIAIHFLNAI